MHGRRWRVWRRSWTGPDKPKSRDPRCMHVWPVCVMCAMACKARQDKLAMICRTALSRWICPPSPQPPRGSQSTKCVPRTSSCCQSTSTMLDRMNIGMFAEHPVSSALVSTSCPSRSHTQATSLLSHPLSFSRPVLQSSATLILNRSHSNPQPQSPSPSYPWVSAPSLLCDV